MLAPSQKFMTNFTNPESGKTLNKSGMKEKLHVNKSSFDQYLLLQ